MNQIAGIPSDELSPKIRPQDDLFRHVNEHWMETTSIPPDKATYGTFVMLAEQAELSVRAILEEARTAPAATQARKLGDLYTSFMDVDAINRNDIEPIRPLFDEIDAIGGVQDLLALLGKTQRDGLASAFHLFVDSDPGDPSRYLVFIEQGGLSLPDERYYREEHFAPIHDGLAAHITRMLELAGRGDAANRAGRIIALEDELAHYHWDNVACRDSVKTYNLVSFDDLKASTAAVSPTFALDIWARGLGAPDDALAEVVLRQPSFLEGLARLFTDDHLDAWKDWLTWRVIHASAPYLPEAFVQENFSFYGKVLTGTDQLRDRWKRGVAFVEGGMGEAIGQIYVERHFDLRAKEQMDQLVANLLAAYRERITSLDWMTPETRGRALEKLDTFRPKIGYPIKWKDYSSLTVNATNLWDNIRHVAKWHFDRELNKIGQPVDRDEWFMTPQTVNAYYNPGFNEIVFPAAILQYPFFDADRDAAANYGAIGAVIGHEIGHGFDDEGSRYDGDGRLHDWWTPQDREAFEERTRSLIAQYDALAPRHLPDHHVNGSLTIGENIGDLGGLGIAWVAYQLSLAGQEPPVIEGLSAGQRFFYAWALGWRDKRRDEEMLRRLATDPHSPNEFRCNQVVRNIDAFHEAFATTPSDSMWLSPTQRVRIW
ncbi:M13-type metalloendopeptidase [Ferrimicrobium sp.]|uniref:M13 family metallopeptidase n=1 Tax=Ferrimicrobium sp. TaxID=2926050 RepID=UPI002622ACE0|nr:M13-type metalloendopeptidase [Ferrimicrobium sp.]